MSAEVSVNDNEQVTLSLIGTLKVGGLPPAAIEKLIAQRLKDGEYLRNPQVSVQVRQVRSQMISVLGEVVRPGRFPIVGKLTVLEALATAGGLGPRADRTVSLLRKSAGKDGSSERQEIPVRLDQLGDPSRGELDIELRNDDVVFVAPQKMFYVHGEVRRPGAYPMEPDLNVMRVLSISGGVTERGSLRRIRIHRKTNEQRTQEITPDLNTSIVNGDVVYVDERLF
jgi:polysaccharide export outer membrane protein